MCVLRVASLFCFVLFGFGLFVLFSCVLFLLLLQPLLTCSGGSVSEWLRSGRRRTEAREHSGVQLQQQPFTRLIKGAPHMNKGGANGSPHHRSWWPPVGMRHRYQLMPSCLPGGSDLRILSDSWAFEGHAGSLWCAARRLGTRGKGNPS